MDQQRRHENLKMTGRARMRLSALAIVAGFAGLVWPHGALAAEARVLIDNDRVVVQEVQGQQSPATRDFVAVALTGEPAAEPGRRGDAPGRPGVQSFIIELKDRPIAPLANASAYPLAFPRPHAERLFETDRVVVWRFTPAPGEPTPTHFHDKDAVVVYLNDMSVESDTLDGAAVVGHFKRGEVRFLPRGRIHSELLRGDPGTLIVTELKSPQSAGPK